MTGHNVLKYNSSKNMNLPSENFQSRKQLTVYKWFYFAGEIRFIKSDTEESFTMVVRKRCNSQNEMEDFTLD